MQVWGRDLFLSVSLGPGAGVAGKARGTGGARPGRVHLLPTGRAAAASLLLPASGDPPTPRLRGHWQVCGGGSRPHPLPSPPSPPPRRRPRPGALCPVASPGPPRPHKAAFVPVASAGPRDVSLRDGAAGRARAAAPSGGHGRRRASRGWGSWARLLAWPPTAPRGHQPVSSAATNVRASPEPPGSAPFLEP